MTAEPRRTLRSHSAAEPQLNEVGFEEPVVWSQELSLVRKTSSWFGRDERGRIFDIALLLRARRSIPRCATTNKVFPDQASAKAKSL